MISCGKEFPLTDVRFTCTCGNLLDAEHDLSALKKKFRLSRRYFNGKRSAVNGQPSGGVWHFREIVLPSFSIKKSFPSKKETRACIAAKKFFPGSGLQWLLTLSTKGKTRQAHSPVLERAGRVFSFVLKVKPLKAQPGGNFPASV